MKWLALVLLVAGCVAAPDGTGLPLRNPTAPVASQTDATLARLAGDWRVVEGAGVPMGAGVSFGPDRAVVAGRAVSVADAGQGRLMLDDQAVWVFWIDADDRTAALGDPDGRRVWIMDRTGQPGERLRAARDILEWYGYDLTRLAAP